MTNSIAIDGPVGAGKSTISDQVAARLGILHLDTGAMYRAAGVAVLRAGLNQEDEQQISAFVQEKVEVSVSYRDGGQRTLLNGEDVTALLRTEAVSQAASRISQYAAVRKKMVACQQREAAAQPMLVDGRDIGTVVLPDAKVKIYLTAQPEARARRRCLQMEQAGEKADYATVLQEVLDRDHRDMTRKVDPLRQAKDAVLVDSSELSFEETVEAILTIVRQKNA